jgi:hypothetical protein
MLLPCCACSLVPIQDTQSENSHSMYRIMQRRTSPPTFQPLQSIPTVFIICNQHAREVRATLSSKTEHPCMDQDSKRGQLQQQQGQLQRLTDCSLQMMQPSAYSRCLP